MPGTKKMSAPKKINKVKNNKVTKSKVDSTVVKSPVVETPVVETPVVETPVVSTVETTVVDNDTVSNYSEEFSHLLGQLKGLQNTLKELTNYTMKLEKRVSKDQRAVQKRVTGKRKRVSNGQPSGFSKPGPVSDEMREFLKLENGELIARTQCTKRINAYCKEHGLQGEKDKRILNADGPLRKLLRLNKTDELTFFNLQKYMKIHFPNKEGIYPTA